MTKARKIILIVLSVVLALGLSLSLFSFTGCGGGDDSKELASITLNTDNVKKTYVTGQTLDTTGLVVTANFADGTTKELTAEEYVIDGKDTPLKVNDNFMSTNFQSTKSIKVSYTKGEVTKSRNFSVTITNKVKEATINTEKSKHATTYYVGQSFNVAGLVLNAVLEDNSTVEVNVTSDNSTVEGGKLALGVKQVTINVGGFNITIPIVVQNALYVEAETGYRNGKPIEQSMGESGNIRTDATAELAAEYATELYEAHLKAAFAESKLKETSDWSDDWATTAATAAEQFEALGGTESVYRNDIKVGGEILSKLYTETVKWLNDEANADAIEEYVASDEFTAAVAAFEAGTNEDIAEWNYADLVTHNTASGSGSEGNEYYLGQNNQNDTISFVFESSAATDTATVSFRLSSAYLYADSGWKAIVMGDVKFADLCDIAVNGINQPIPEDKILYGGKTEDGSICQGLWINWDEVVFNNVSLVEGRNVVEMKVKQHGIAAQENYNFAANIDTLIVAPGTKSDGSDAADMSTFDDESAEIVADVTSVTVADEEGKAVVTVSGTYSAKVGEDTINGYLVDLVGNNLACAVGTVNATVTLKDGNAFEAKADVTTLDLGTYEVTSGGAAITIEGYQGSTASVGGDFPSTYTLATKEGGSGIQLTITSDYKVEVTSTEIKSGEKIKLEMVAEDDKAIIKITGGVEFTTEGYNMQQDKDKAAVKAVLEQKIKPMFYTDIQNDGTGNNWTYPLGKDFHTVTVDVDAKTFTINLDVTNYTLGIGMGMLHFAPYLPDGSGNTDPANKDYKPEIEKVEATVQAGGNEFKFTYDPADSGTCFGLPYFSVTKVGAAVIESTTVVNEGDKPMLTITGTCTVSAEVLKSQITLYFDKVTEGQITDVQYTVPAAKIDATEEQLNVTVQDGKFTIKFDASVLPEGAYWTHFGIEEDKDLEPADSTVTVGGKTYGFEKHTVSWGGTRVFFMVYTAAA